MTTKTAPGREIWINGYDGSLCLSEQPGTIKGCVISLQELAERDKQMRREGFEAGHQEGIGYPDIHYVTEEEMKEAFEKFEKERKC